MADKQFIGKVTEKIFNNGGSVLKLSLNEKDKAMLTTDGFTNILIKKSTKGNWYAEIDTWQPSGQQSAPARSATPDPQRDEFGDLPF